MLFWMKLMVKVILIILFPMAPTREIFLKIKVFQIFLPIKAAHANQKKVVKTGSIFMAWAGAWVVQS